MKRESARKRVRERECAREREGGYIYDKEKENMENRRENKSTREIG